MMYVPKYLFIEGLSQVRPKLQHFWEPSCHRLKDLKQSNHSLLALMHIDNMLANFTTEPQFYYKKIPKATTIKRISL